MFESMTLSSTELALLKDLKYLPMKHAILDKMEGILGVLRNEISTTFTGYLNAFPPELDVKQGKISRGDNYKMYPYRVLDYPKALNGSNIFTFRSLVLWGHHCSFHLILAGVYKKALEDRIIARAADLPESVNLSSQVTPWEWEFDPEHYVQARALQEPAVAAALKESPFLKISYFMPLERYLEIPATGREIWNLWQTVLFSK